MPKIKALDPITVTKIAAGEVIDRPASIVKELLENSLDSGATSINIQLEHGGKSLIQVTDDGHGIDKSDLQLALTRHATSKLTHIEDIFSINSFGFRGEALASMCHVAQVDLTSATDTGAAYHIACFQDEFSQISPASHPKGSTIRVRDLFFDIPVRAKFLKADNTEFSHCLDVIQGMALLNPQVQFSCSHGGGVMFSSSGDGDIKQLLYATFGRQLKDHLMPIEGCIGPITFHGTMSDPTITFANRSRQVLAVNGRLVKSPVIIQALSQSFRDILPPKRFAAVVLNLEIDSNIVDVNIHPQKLDIKFMNPGFIFNALPKVIKTSLQTHHSELPIPKQTDVQASQPTQSDFSSFTYTPVTPSVQAVNASQNFYKSAAEEFNPLKNEAALNNTTSTLPLTVNSPLEFMTFLDTYIILKGKDKIWILDQHAVHERILYEQFKITFENEALISQPLLVSEVVDIGPKNWTVLEAHWTDITQLGFVIEAFGDSEIVVREVPNHFKNIALEAWFNDYLESSQDGDNFNYTAILDHKDRLQMKACKAAIKAGKRMKREEIIRLLTDLQKSPSNYTCPHGRPLFVTMNQANLERLFLRST